MDEMKYPRVQDISLDEEIIWTQFKNYWNLGNYTAALNLVKDIDWDAYPEFLNASIFNALTETIVKLEPERDPDFRNNRIQVVMELPEEAEVDEVFMLADAQYNDTFTQTITSDGLTYRLDWRNGQWQATKL